MAHAELAARATGRAPGRAGRSPGTVVAWLTARKAVRSGAIWGYIFGVAIASSAVSYTRIYKTPAQREALAAAYGANKATSALFGPAPQLQTVAGFTVFKISMTLMLLGAVWGLLTSTRLLRGEEDNGRWELLLAGQTTRGGAAAQALGGLGAGVFTLWAVTSLITVLTGLYSSVGIAAGPALYFALAMVATAVMFLAAGALTSQLAATRRQAASYAASFLGVSYAVRMIADAGLGLHGLIWASPLGWVEELRPLTAPQPLALLPIAAFTAVLAAAAVHLAGTRDAGASVVPDRDTSRPHLRLLTGPAGLALRLVRPAVISWWAAIAVSGLLFGLIAKSAGGTISGSSARQVLAKLGAPGTGAAAVLGVLPLLLLSLPPPDHPPQEAGTLDHLLSFPSPGRGGSAGSWSPSPSCWRPACWPGPGLARRGQPARGGLHHDVEAGVNLVPPPSRSWHRLLAFGVWPRGTAIVVYVLLGWSLFAVVIGGIGAISHWILDTSVFHQMASAPAVPPHWEANGVMVAIGVASALIGGIAFSRRDLQGQ